MNVRELAKKVAAREGGKQNLSIAQIAEVLRIALTEMANHSDDEIRAAIRRAIQATCTKALR